MPPPDPAVDAVIEALLADERTLVARVRAALRNEVPAYRRVPDAVLNPDIAAQLDGRARCGARPVGYRRDAAGNLTAIGEQADRERQFTGVVHVLGGVR